MSKTLKIKRGNRMDLPALSSGEFGLATDTSELFIGGDNGNIQIPTLQNGEIPGSLLPAIGLRPQIYVTVNSGSAVSCTCAGTYLSATSASGYATFDIPRFGNWRVSATLNGVTVQQVVSVDVARIYNISLGYYSTTLSANTWQQIAAASSTGQASALWPVGSEITISVGNENLACVVVGHNHDDLITGGKAGITFALKDTMAATQRIAATNEYTGGFTDSEIYPWLQTTVLNSLPADLQAVIKPVNKITQNSIRGNVFNTDGMKLFLFSEQEVFGEKKESAGWEGSYYSYFTATNRNKNKMWWLRSPNRFGEFCIVSDALASSREPAKPGYVCFGFCV